MPEITGDTAKGRSMSVSSVPLPGNWNFAIAQLAARPKARFSGTAMAAVSSVSRIAAHASGSRRAVTYAPRPFSRAWAKTAASGSTRKTARNTTATTSRAARTMGGSVGGRLTRVPRAGSPTTAAG